MELHFVRKTLGGEFGHVAGFLGSFMPVGNNRIQCASP